MTITEVSNALNIYAKEDKALLIESGFMLVTDTSIGNVYLELIGNPLEGFKKVTVFNKGNLVDTVKLENLESYLVNIYQVG